MLGFVLLTAGTDVLAEDPVRVMSYNIRYATAPDGENAWDKRKLFLIETIQKYDPDLLGTQETLAIQRDALAAALKGHTAFAAGRDDGKDKGEMAARLANMPNEEVRRKWATVSETGYSDEELADARRRLGNCITRLESLLAEGGPWLLGDEYTLADIKWYSMAPALPRVMPDACNPDATPAIAGWLERMASRPAVGALGNYTPQR